MKTGVKLVEKGPKDAAKVRDNERYPKVVAVPREGPGAPAVRQQENPTYIFLKTSRTCSGTQSPIFKLTLA